ncbi:uncharacterized protein (DUF885 family) [Sphingomonas jejuensis]|uniref:Uncharacterized protein (DUF885 family) n=1 Tax=Sphingomonas jejuensis TaxID=904715 RepID=A0ABX0XK65_9SPHN|nr:DUF885 family protein [Sphingomonas jejuensis]NJC33747.1 uncharacterized protein (DUF885 family) [Sphingomonas jejuensis]
MDRRAFMSGTALATAGMLLPARASSQTPAPPAVGRTAEDQRLRQMLDRFFEQRVADSPEAMTRLGTDVGPAAAMRRQLDDRSASAKAVEDRRTTAELQQLRTINRDALSPAGRIDHDVVAYQLERSVAGQRYTFGSAGGRYSPYVLSQLSGAYRDLPDFMESQHPVRDASDADAYLARLEAMPVAFDQELERQRADAAAGIFAPDYILDTTLVQLRNLRDRPAAETVLVTALAAKLSAANLPPSAAARAATIVEQAIHPALDRQIALVTELRGRATHDAGVWRLPQGADYYADAIKAATTTDYSADDVHRIGLEQVAEIEARIDSILREQGMTGGTVGARLVALNERPDQLFANTDAGRAELLAQLNAQVLAMNRRLPELFGTLPQAPVEVRRVPAHIQAGAPGGYYQAASLDGTRPGIYYINLRDTFDRPKFGLATLTHHEATPGHHLQVSLAQESDDIPMLRRRGGFSAYSEGWALYSEQLADEIGMFEGDPLGRVGYLQSLLFRATRLVVDTGLHHKRWSRERATDYLIATTGIARGRSQGEIDRYTVWPGQATSYKIGHTVWTRLRDEERQRRGDAFDPKRFHQVLLLGAMPLAVLERVVREQA